MSEKVKESFLPVFKDECCDQGCDNHNERHSDCDYLVNCQTCKKSDINKEQRITIVGGGNVFAPVVQQVAMYLYSFVFYTVHTHCTLQRTEGSSLKK